MSFAIAIYTSDPNLMRCELARLRGEIAVDPEASEPMGAGWYSEENVLLQRYSARVRPERLELLGPDLQSDALLVHAAPLPLGMSLEENTQPFRFRRWLFAHQGQPFGGRFRAEVQDLLPDHLARTVRGATESELAFALFLTHLREVARADGSELDATTVARTLGRTARTAERLSGGRAGGMCFFATDNDVLVAARLGTLPLYFRLLEGAPTCELHKMDGSAESAPTVRAHLRRKSVVVATNVTHPSHWIEVESGTAVGVGRSLHVEQVRF